MTFRAQAIADLPTFTNVDEMGDTVTLEIDGQTVSVACVVEGEGDTQDSRDGVINRDTLLYVRESDLPSVPAVRQRIVMDGEQADVMAVSEDLGLLEIRLRWLDS